MIYNIKDSGERTAFASGAVRDMQKDYNVTTELV